MILSKITIIEPIHALKGCFRVSAQEKNDLKPLYQSNNKPQIRDVSKANPLVQITGSSLSDEKAKLVRNALEAAVAEVCQKHGLTVSRFTSKKVDNGEISIAVRCSEKNGLGFDSLLRDLFNYCGKLGFSASIVNATLVIEGQEHQINGIDISSHPFMFRLLRVSDQKQFFMARDTVKKNFPDFFTG